MVWNYLSVKLLLQTHVLRSVVFGSPRISRTSQYPVNKNIKKTSTTKHKHSWRHLFFVFFHRYQERTVSFYHTSGSDSPQPAAEVLIRGASGGTALRAKTERDNGVDGARRVGFGWVPSGFRWIGGYWKWVFHVFLLFWLEHSLRLGSWTCMILYGKDWKMSIERC